MANLITLLNRTEDVVFVLTEYVPMSKYRVNNIVNYKEWTDSNYKVHRRKTDEKAEGDFTLRFPSITAYSNFIRTLNEFKNPDDGSIKADVWLTNEFKTRRMSIFLDFEPQNDLPLLADNKSDGFVVTLTERG